MIDNGYVIGSAVQARDVVVGKGKVYVHTDITPLERTEEEMAEGCPQLYSYHELVYTTQEYIGMMSAENAKLKDDTDTAMLAIAELAAMVADGN